MPFFKGVDVDTLELLRRTRKIVFFGGAGTSTESGIPDFRSSDGLYSKSPEEWLSSDYLYRHTDEFYRFYKENMLYPDAKPNLGHKILAKWEEEGRLLGIITQNIDGLHQLAGSKKVVELHGSVLRNYCEACKKSYSLQEIIDQPGTPHCNSCHGLIRPDVVLYGEMLDRQVIEDAVKLLREAELLIVGGTSLVVYPAAGMLQYYGGDKIIMINKGSTSYDGRADLVLRNGFVADMQYLDAQGEP